MDSKIEVLTIRVAARRFKMRDMTLRRLVADGEIPGYQLPGERGLRVKWSECVAWLNLRRARSTKLSPESTPEALAPPPPSSGHPEVRV